MCSSQPAGSAVERRVVHFSGRVQGVGFRYTARQIAARFPVSGYVQNLSDGRVLLVAEGTADALARFLAALAAEMDRYVTGAQVAHDAASGEFANFDIRH